MSKLSVNLVTWNGVKYIPFLFESLRKQSFHDWDLVVVDNNSTDGTIVTVQKELIDFPVSSRLIVNKENVGFARGHNQAYAETSSDYFLIINQDLVLAPDCIEKLFNFLSSNPDAAAVAPRTMRWNFEEKKLTNIVDSLGLKVFRNRRVVEINEGEEYTNPSPSQTEGPPRRVRGQGEVSSKDVFGVSGAAPMFRRQAIVQIGYFFDEDFNSYKEDVDLAYRLQSVGRKSFVIPDAVAYHDRSGGGTKHKDDYSSAINKNKQTPLVRYHSYKNHLVTLYKNEYWQNFILDFPWILWYELKKFIYFLIIDRGVLAGLGKLWKTRHELKQKRAAVRRLRKISWREIRKWWN